jgi:hypothetical protein
LKGNNGTTFIFIPTTNELPTYEEVLYQKQNEANGHNPLPPQFLALPPVINLTEVILLNHVRLDGNRATSTPSSIIKTTKKNFNH